MVCPAALGKGADILIVRMGLGIVDGGQGDEAIEQIGTDRFTQRSLLACEVQDIVHDLEGHANLVAELTHGLHGSHRRRG